MFDISGGEIFSVTRGLQVFLSLSNIEKKNISSKKSPYLFSKIKLTSQIYCLQSLMVEISGGFKLCQALNGFDTKQRILFTHSI